MDAESAEAAMISTDESTGPMQGLQAKLITKPIKRAVRGDIVSLPKSKGSRTSRLSSLLLPNTPS